MLLSFQRAGVEFSPPLARRSETTADRQHCLQAARDYLYDQLPAGYDVYQSKVAHWQG